MPNSFRAAVGFVGEPIKALMRGNNYLRAFVAIMAVHEPRNRLSETPGLRSEAG